MESLIILEGASRFYCLDSSGLPTTRRYASESFKKHGSISSRQIVLGYFNAISRNILTVCDIVKHISMKETAAPKKLI